MQQDTFSIPCQIIYVIYLHQSNHQERSRILQKQDTILRSKGTDMFLITKYFEFIMVDSFQPTIEEGMLLSIIETQKTFQLVVEGISTEHIDQIHNIDLIHSFF